ncbi:hypothetical protein D3C81_1866020 [compost metagenome]
MNVQLTEDLQYPAADGLRRIGKGLIQKHRTVNRPILAFGRQHIGQAGGDNSASEGFFLSTGFTARR